MYEKLLLEYTDKVEVYERNMRLKGLYSDNVIAISSRLNSSTEKACILAEELGHHYTSAGDILDQTKLSNVKQEKRARSWAYERLIPLNRLIDACAAGCRNRYELAEYLEVTEEFLDEAIKRYKEKYGLFYTVNNYTIYFEPLGVLNFFTQK